MSLIKSLDIALEQMQYQDSKVQTPEVCVGCDHHPTFCPSCAFDNAASMRKARKELELLKPYYDSLKLIHKD